MTSFACIFQIDIILNIIFSPNGIVRSILGLSPCSFGLAPHCCNKGSIFLPIAESTVVKLGLWRCSSCLGPLHCSVLSSGRALQCGQWEPAGCLCDPVPAPPHLGPGWDPWQGTTWHLWVPPFSWVLLTAEHGQQLVAGEAGDLKNTVLLFLPSAAKALVV